MFEVELGPLTGLNQFLSYSAHLAWTQVHGSDSGVIAIRPHFLPLCAFADVLAGTDGTVKRVPQNGTTYHIQTPISNLGDGRLLVNLTINLYCTTTIGVFRTGIVGLFCRCSQWQIRWISDSLEISAKKG